MFSISLELKTRGKTPQAIERDLRFKINLALARAADIIVGALHRYSTIDELHKRTGNLARDWRVEPRDELTFVAINRMPYAAIHEYGDTVRPKTAKALAIPMGEALTAGGVPRFTGPRAVPGLFVYKSDGKAYLARSVDKRLEVLYALRSSVVIPARRYATKAGESVRDKVTAEIERAMK